jgi:trigger factor
MEQEKVEPYTRPRVESIEFEPLRLKAVVGLSPKVELGDYKGTLRVAAEEPSVGDEQVDTVIQRLRDSYAQWVPVDRPVQIGDRVGLDLRASVEGREEPILDSKEAEYVVDSAGAQPAPGFAEQLVGLKAGDEKKFTLTMPEDYRDEEIASKPAEFSVTLHWVKERELPALDDAFAQQVGDYADLAALRAAIENQVREREAERVREKLEEEAMSKLVEISSVEFPPQLVDHQKQHMIDTFTRNVERQGLQLTQYLRLIGKEREAFDEEMRSEAESRIRRSLVLDAFADAEAIEPEQQDADSAARTRETKALARLVELATGDGRNGDAQSGQEKTADQPETSDTERQTRIAAAPNAPAAEES